ncbi:MAG: DEAD/DEAH box helicase family protein [Bacteroidaceae bacterium]|nr:DEAD/DEAH box helicase family protein [Bacteroidaceae bacterium]
MQARLDNGKNVSGYQINRLVDANESAMLKNDTTSIRSAAENRLVELGERGDVKAIAEALTKQASGEKLTYAEKRTISNSKFGQRVANELNTENINSGGYSSAWAERIGTDRINPEEYSRLIAETETAPQEPQTATAQNIETAQAGNVQEAQTIPATENPTAQENVAEAKIEASTEVSQTEESGVTLESASEKYGAQAGAMVSTYTEGQDVAKYDAAYQVAYDMGKSGVSLSYAMNSEATAYLTEKQRELAHAAGADASTTTAKEQDTANKAKANGKTGRRKGTVKGEGVTISDLKSTFNDTQNTAYKLLSTYAEATGIDIVLFKSEPNADGTFEGAQGKFKWSEDTIYIDINAGLANIKGVNDLAKYTMLRTFSHEFCHFIEKWNPIWYNEFRKVVFDTLTERGENVNDLIETKQAQSEGMDYDKASREVVAEAMTDILPDANFVEELATKHKTIFDKLLGMLKEFVSDLKEYFNSIGHNSSREANALKEQVGESVKYVENIVKLFDKVALEAVENYQMTVATEAESNNNTDGGINNAEQEQRTETVHPGGNSISEGSQEEDGDRSGVSEENRGIRQAPDRPRGRRGELSQTEKRFSEDSFIVPKKGTAEAEEYAKLAEYGIEGYVVKKSAWDRNVQAFSNGGKIYIREGLDEKYRGMIVPHEATHVMKQLQFQPYLDFIARTPDMLDTTSDMGQRLIERPANNYGIDLFDITANQIEKIYDEINATIYGHYSAGQIVGDLKANLDNAFHDFDAYINELASIHEQFKKENAPKKSVDETVAETVAETEVPKAEKAKPVRTKKSDWASHDVEWHIPGKKSPIAYSTVASSDLIEVLVEDNPSATIKEIFEKVNYDEEAKKVLQQYIDAGYGDQVANEWFNHNKQEANTNVENADNRGTIQQPEPDRSGDTRVLDEPQTEDVPRDVQRGDAVGDSVERGQETRRDDVRSDIGEQTRRESSEGDRQSGDLRRDDRITSYKDAESYAKEKGYRLKINKMSAKKNIIQVDIYDKQGLPTFAPVIIGELGKDSDVTKWNQVKEAIDKREATDNSATDINDGGKAAEALHEEVTEQVAQQSTEQPKGRNFVIGDSLDLPNGEKSRYKANIEAIRLVKQLESESRYATEAEQAILSKYIGWGGLSDAFDEKKSDWSKEYTELKELLTDEEFRAARASTTDAFYTDIPVIKAMYGGLERLGFNGGRMLEPSSGVGNFVGAMPTAMTSKVKSWTMVELDSITGLIAKHLYPNADVRIQGFEKANIPDNYMDVAIGNVPFGKVAIYDKAYPKKVTSAIHNYFFAKALDKVRPGGIVMFITSSYTMSSRDNTVRRYIMQKADLLGAIRLPNSAFKSNAGTDVVADILILKKRAANTTYSGEDFLEAPYNYKTGEYANNYFENHPEMVLGVPTATRGRYGETTVTYKPLTDRGSLADQIREAFSHIEGKMEYPATLSREKTNFAVERASKKTKENGLVVKEGKVYQNKGGELVEINKANGAAERISAMLEIRDAARNLINYQQQGLNDTEIKKARTELNKVYDAFVKKYGFINSQANRNAFIEDPDRYSLFALENWNPETKKATKADIFSKNTISPNRTVTSAKDVAEGLIVSVNQTGGVDTALIARITGKTEADVTRELIDSRKAFKNRNGDLETAETYLSGNVRAKLRDAEALVPLDADYKNNVEALKSVMPEDVGYQDIFVNPGTPWIPNSVYSDFAAYMLGGRNSEWRQDVDVTRNRDTGNFTVELKGRHLKMNSANTQKWGTSRRTFLDLFDAMLNSKSVVIKDKLDDGSFVVNKDATAAANEKIENIQKEFQEWLWRDEARRGELATLYNEVFNSVVTPKYNGENLTVNGMNAEKSLRPHQKDAVQRVISSGGNTLLAHRVGAGKTFEMAASAMKLKELGLVKKPMFAVPKSLVAQWGKEFMDIFPTAKLLVAEASDFTAANRKVFMNRIANGEYDAVIVSYEQFEKLPMSDDFTRQLYQEQIDSVIAAIEEAKADKGDKALSVKDLEKKRKSLQAKIDKLTDKAKDEDNIDFEQLGVDSLFVDEAHNFKNLFYTTSMTNVAGLGNKDGSKRAFDLYTKVRYLQQLNGGRGIVFATATPVMNSMSEMYIMQKYLQPDLLNQLGLSTFDAWAKQFGEVVNGVEIKPSGQGYRVKQSFSRFKNMSELQLLFRNFADVLTDVPGLKIPTMKGGKVNVVVCEPGQFQRDYMKELEQRADNIKNVDPSEDNMLKITSDGRKISYTQRMIDPSLPYEEGCKIYRCADNVLKEYNESKSIKGTQLIFCDMATPKGASNNNATATEDIETDMESAQLYDDLKTRLRQGGIPAKEIAFIHEADTDAKKKKLFDDVNEGKVRVLIGSTGKMGVGMNAQKRIVAIHHLDAPWRPGDVEQRDGRAFRQKNINEEVSKYTYVTEGSFDARLWDILDRKQNFINQVMNGENVGRETEDTGEVTLSAAEVKALASGSPLIMEQVELDTAIKKLESLYRAHISAVRSAKERLSRDNGQIASLEKQIANGKADIAARKDTYSDEKFSITVGNKKYTDKKEAGVALMAEATTRATFDSYNTIGNFAGFELRVIKSSEGINGLLVGKQGYPFKTYPSNTTFMISQLAGVAESIDERVKLWEHDLTEVQKDIAEQEKLIAEPFAKQAELDQKRARYNEVMEILNPKEEQSLDSVSEDTVQEQSREYLNSDEQEQQRTNTLTDREVLAMAAEELLMSGKLTDAERDAVQIFKSRLSRLEGLQDDRAEQGRLYKEQQFGANVDREAAAQTLNRMRVLDEQIKAASTEVLSVEDKEVLGNVLKKARKVVETAERQHGAEILKRWRDRTRNSAAIKKYRERIKADVTELTNWVLKPNNKDIVKHIPDALKNTVIPFLSSIDFTSKQQLRGGEATKADTEFVTRLNALKSALKQNIDVSGMYSGYNDLPPNFMEKLQSFIDDIQKLVGEKSGEFVINRMTSEELKELSSVVRVLKAYITQVNKFHANAMYQHVYNAGDNSIEALSAMSSDDGKAGGVSNFVFWQQIRPAFAFERFGNGGVAIYDSLRRGQAQLAFNTQKIVEFAEKTYTTKEVNDWEKEIKEINLGGKIVKMRVSDIMSFYELSKQPDSLRHMLGEGFRVATYTQGGKKISDNGHPLTEQNIADIVNALTPRQKEVADALQKFMQEQGGAWGNYVSIKRFGEELFTNEKYFPINSDGRHLQSTADEQPSAASLYALLNMSFTKSRNEKANNRIVVYSIFDVFSNHMASMAQYNAMALPVLDAIKWFNYQQKTEDADGNRYVANSVREQMSRVYGVPEESRPGSGRQGYAETFVLNILKAFNGTEAQGIPTDTIGMNATRRYNMAQVAYNFRVVVQQPLAITRAALLIDYGSIMKGLKLRPSAIKQNIEEMRKYSGIAAWKSLGFYDVNISRGLTDTIKHKSTVMDKIGDVGMWGAEQADTITWAAMWSACKAEVQKKQNLKPGDDGFYEAVTKVFEDVIYKTQVVDSVLTKNEFLRSKGAFARLVGSFMSEPTTTASMVIDAVDKYNADLKRGMTRSQAWDKNKRMIGRTIYSYAVSAVILAAVQAVADAMRDDDDYETFIEKWLEAFGGNVVDEIMPINKLPILADFYDLAKELASIFGVDTYGNPPQSVFMQWYDSLVNGVEILYDKISGEDTNYTWYGGIYKLLQAVSGMAGLPMAAATREIITAWNNIVGAMAPSLKVKTYDPGDKNEIKYAYQDGYLTFDEAASELLEQGLVDNEDEAYFTVSGWEAGDGYSRYDSIYDAVRNGGDLKAAMSELTSHGYTEKDIYSKVKSKVGEWYRGGEISKAQATSMLEKYTDMDSDEITEAVNKWSAVVVTGIEYDDIDDEVMAGNITVSRAIEMYMRYGGMTQEKAIEKVSVLSFVIEHPNLEGISYSAVNAYNTYCEPYGIEAEVFYDIWQYNSSVSADVDANGKAISGSKKAKVLAYINSMSLSARQKDSLYYAFGWAQSTINEAPWH